VKVSGIDTYKEKEKGKKERKKETYIIYGKNFMAEKQINSLV